ncbi:MAG: 6-carboxytetrahydropterin synthase [Nitrospira sp.]|nr:6-carboxytetrahydropterin synthase [Nitrospira sp.]MCB9710864.1 6-carboxytetrahydropterin synthase [Nitrospiraceae bacterium]MDR4486500.1 6-carboxytetrahydropterin synthase [Nitrospirales bacterium]HQU29212.1 6-carboxytetrahydropterin synthase [Nitrospirales bacterium]
MTANGPTSHAVSMPTHTITRSYKFCAAHRLHTDQLPPDVNQKIFGKCNNANGHGHNYTVHVTVQGELNPETGLITDVDLLDRRVKELIVDRFDHQHLNCDPAFEHVVTTGENLAKLVWEILIDQIPSGRLAKIGVVETRDNFFEYIGNPQP